MARRDLDEWFWQVGTDLHRLTEEMFTSRPTLSRRFWEPRIDLVESPNEYILKADIAGVRLEDVQLNYVRGRNSIVLRGLRHEEDAVSIGRTGIFQLEIYYGEFEREVKLPSEHVDLDAIRAHYRNGFLFVIVPKRSNGKADEEKA